MALMPRERVASVTELDPLGLKAPNLSDHRHTTRMDRGPLAHTLDRGNQDSSLRPLFNMLHRVDMFTQILTDLERRQVLAYIKADGAKITNIRVAAAKAQQPFLGAAREW